jgi:hypothetical protein
MTGATDPHQRFGEWLLAGAPGEPARDLALHASVCPGCMARVAALDLLAAVDTGRARPPSSAALRRKPAPSGRGAMRYAEAFFGAIILAGLVGLGARVIDLRALTGPAGANPEGTPTQAVLGGTGRPSLTPEPSASESGESTASASPTNAVTPTSVPQPVNPPAATVRPATPTPSTAAPTPGPTPTATPTSAETATPTVEPTPSDSPTPTPTP